MFLTETMTFKGKGQMLHKNKYIFKQSACPLNQKCPFFAILRPFSEQKWLSYSNACTEMGNLFFFLFLLVFPFSSLPSLRKRMISGQLVTTTLWGHALNVVHPFKWQFIPPLLSLISARPQMWKCFCVEVMNLRVQSDSSGLSCFLKSFLLCGLQPWFYQASELSQLDPGEGTSVSLVRAQECGGDCSCSMFPLSRVSRAAGEWPDCWPLWLSSSCTRKLM